MVFAQDDTGTQFLKIPRYVRFMTSFPMTVTGKVAKYLLREQINHELSGHQKEAA